MKKLVIIFLVCLSFFAAINSAQAVNGLNAYFFYGEGCPHCAGEKQFLSYTLRDKYPSLHIHEYEIYNNRENIKFLEEVAAELGVQVDGVPFLVIGDKYFVGYAGELTASQIEHKINECLNMPCPDSVAGILGLCGSENSSAGQSPVQSGPAQKVKDKDQTINLPVLGQVGVSHFSLPILTIVMGALDGFNPCALWTLLFLISLLLGIKDRRRMWLLGAVFIITSALVYFLFMAAWLHLILFLGFVIWVRLLIALLALFGGGYNIKQFLFNKDSGCKVTSDEKRQKVFEKLKKIIGQKSFLLALGGIIILAFAVNLVELICSAGLPAIYTQVLALSDLAPWQYYLYILLYIFVFMLDDLFVFFVAMTTLQMTGITTKYSRYSKFIGGVLMLIIGLLLLFKPDWLMFG